MTAEERIIKILQATDEQKEAIDRVLSGKPTAQESEESAGPLLPGTHSCAGKIRRTCLKDQAEVIAERLKGGGLAAHTYVPIGSRFHEGRRNLRSRSRQLTLQASKVDLWGIVEMMPADWRQGFGSILVACVYFLSIILQIGQ